MVSDSIVNRAIREACNSDVIRGKIGAVLFTQSGHIIASAHNAAFLGSSRIRTIHAEEFLLQKAYKIKAAERYGEKLNLLVIRWKPGVKELGNAKPCSSCQRALRKTRFNIYYSNNSKQIVQLGGQK